MEKDISKLLTKYKDEWDRDTQRPELLLRNEDFLKELKVIKKKIGRKFFFKVKNISLSEAQDDTSEENIFLKNDFPNEIIYPGRKYWKETKVKFDIARRHDVLRKFRKKWEEFCSLWHLDSEWSGDLRSLKNYIKSPVAMYLIESKGKETFAIILELDNWASLNDIKKVWNKVEKYQNKIWKKQEKRTNFSRDLCWYDLYTKCGLFPKQIADMWILKFPDDIDLLVVRRIKKGIEKDDLNGKRLNDRQLISEMKSGFLAAGYRSVFEDEREFYISGQTSTKETKNSKSNPPFVETIKKAIQRMKEQINQVNVQYSDLLEELDKRLGVRINAEVEKYYKQKGIPYEASKIFNELRLKKI